MRTRGPLRSPRSRGPAGGPSLWTGRGRPRAPGLATARQACLSSQHGVERPLARYCWAGVRSLLAELGAGRPFPEAFGRARSREAQAFLADFDKKDTGR